jgi:serine/threonine-protein kinase HipA
MQRAERRLAEREKRTVRTLVESDYLLGVADETRSERFDSVWSARTSSRLRSARGSLP